MLSKIEYVGRTKNIESTKARHEANLYRKGLSFVILQDNLSYNRARGYEEYYIRLYQTLNKFVKRNNQIHGVRDNNPNYDVYMAGVCDDLMAIGESCNYIGGRKWIN